MWIKLDDGFATHPKIVLAGPIALALQIRAICYASQHKTDGFLAPAILPYLTIGLAQDVDWISLMLKAGLWESVDDGYVIHDYLHWNMSKEEYLAWHSKLSSGGRKGMKHRYSLKKKALTEVITTDITTVPNSPLTLLSTATLHSSSLNSPSSLHPIPNLKSNGHASEFEQFWVVYPKKVGKKAAEKAWDKAKDRPALSIIIAVVLASRSTEQWLKEHGEFIPHPARWINEGRWHDQPVTPEPSTMQKFLSRQPFRTDEAL